MCGIAGAIAPPDRLDEEALRQLGTRMGAAIAHRGPDDAGHGRTRPPAWCWRTGDWPSWTSARRATSR